MKQACPVVGDRDRERSNRQRKRSRQRGIYAEKKVMVLGGGRVGGPPPGRWEVRRASQKGHFSWMRRPGEK